MMKIHSIPIPLLTLCAITASSQAQSPPPVANLISISLPTAGGGMYSLARIKRNRATVFVFFSQECPICNHFTLKLDSLYRRYSRSGVGFCMVFPDAEATSAMIATYASQRKLGYTMLMDGAQQLTRALSAKITPEAFVISPAGRMLYHGRIDDLYVGLGQYRTTGPTTNELRDAIVAALAGRTVRVKETKAVGCFIPRIVK